jgi:hypothetical protein
LKFIFPKVESKIEIFAFKFGKMGRWEDVLKTFEKSTKFLENFEGIFEIITSSSQTFLNFTQFHFISFHN